MEARSSSATAFRDAVAGGVAAGVLIAAAAGVINFTAFFAWLTPYHETEPRPSLLEEQIRWAAGAGAAFFILAGVGLSRRWLFVLTRSLAALPARRWPYALFAVALALRLAYAVVAAPPPVSDEFYYNDLAVRLVAGEGFCEDGRPTAYWPPGYPLALAAIFTIFGYSLAHVVVFQCVVGAATAVATWRLARYFADELSARLAGVVVAALPSQVAYAARLFPAVVTAFAVVGGLLLIASSRRIINAAAAGVLVGFSALAAPVMFPLAPLTAVVDLYFQRGWKRAVVRAACTTAVAAAVVAPWTYRNYRLFGAFVPISTNGGVILWMGNNDGADGSYSFPLTPTNPLLTVKGELARDRLGRRLAWEYVRAHPTTFLKLTIPKFANLYGADISAFQYDAAAKGTTPEKAARFFSARVAQVLYGLLWGCALWALYKWRRRLFRRFWGWPALAPLLTFALYFTGVYLVFHGLDRYHFPVIPLLAIIAGSAATPATQDDDLWPARHDVK